MLVIAGLSWGTAGTLGALLSAGTGLPFLAVASYRILVGGVLTLAFVLVTRGARWPRTASGWRRVFAVGLSSAAYQITYFSAVGIVGVSIATLITIGSAPVIVAVVDVFTGRHRLDTRLLVTLAVALLGIGLLAGAPPPGIGAGELALGVLLSLAAGSAFANISLLGARPVSDFHDATGTALAFLVGGSTVMVLAAATGPVLWTPTASTVALAIALGLIPSTVAYLAYFRGLRTQTSTTGALVTLLEPITGMILAAVILGERIGMVGALGAACLLTSVALAATGGSAPAEAEASLQ
jgi:DME family drug/metabolite transporter